MDEFDKSSPTGYTDDPNNAPGNSSPAAESPSEGYNPDALAEDKNSVQQCIDPGTANSTGSFSQAVQDQGNDSRSQDAAYRQGNAQYYYNSAPYQRPVSGEPVQNNTVNTQEDPFAEEKFDNTPDQPVNYRQFTPYNQQGFPQNGGMPGGNMQYRMNDPRFYAAGYSDQYGQAGQPNAGAYDNRYRTDVYPNAGAVPPYYNGQPVGGMAGRYDPTGGRPNSCPMDMPKKKRLSTGWIIAFVAIFILMFTALIIILAMISYKRQDTIEGYPATVEITEHEPDKKTESTPAAASSENNGVKVELKITPKPSVDDDLYADKAKGLLTVEGVAAVVSPAVVDVDVFSETKIYPSSRGSGIIISADGYIVTNAHVVSDSALGIRVTLSDGKDYTANVIGSDSKTDLAVLKIDAESLPCAELGDSDQLRLGEMVVAIGNAGGYSGTVTVGHVSGLGRQVVGETTGGSKLECIQTDAAMSPGVSGGALINMYGQVIGVTSSKYKSSELDEGLGFAITMKFAKPIIEDIISKGYISGRARVGITYIAINDYDADRMGVHKGLYVQSIDNSCAVADTELEVGDIITTMNGKEVYSAETVRSVLDNCKPGDVMKAHVFRKGISTGESKEFDIEFELMQDTSLS
ncbi:MAG: S1C family serine protease [Oscillospiraceae bacterium]|nr:S1C family serine protease [Oscillospiraceae bacterium]